MDREVLENIDIAFSLLPEAKALEARAQVVAEYQRQAKPGALLLKWSEHSLGGHLLRGAISDMTQRTTQYVSSVDEDADIAELVRLVTMEGVGAGALVPLHDPERLAWFLPISTGPSAAPSTARLRGMMMTESIFRDVIDRLNPSVDLTGAEHRVLFQIVAGLSPRAAADIDAVSFETKRAHIKSASGKLHCAGQRDLVRKLLGQLVHLLSVGVDHLASAVAEDYVERHLARDARLTVRRLPGGRVLRLIECGPDGGRPVVMIHGMLFPLSLVGVGRHLEAAGIRLIVPVRPGYLEDGAGSGPSDADGLTAQALDDLAAYLRQGQAAPAAIMGQSVGGLLALEFATRHRDLVARLILQSANFVQVKPPDDSHTSEFYRGLRRLTDRPEIFRLVNRQLQRFYAERETGRAILMRLFAGSPVDMNVLAAAIGGAEPHGLLAELYRSSLLGITEDFEFGMESWERSALALDLDLPIAFIHGSNDPLTGAEAITAVAARMRLGQATVIEGGGHLIGVTHADAVWRAVASCLDS